MAAESPTALTVRPVAETELGAAFEVLRELRTHLTPKLFAERLARQRERGYELLGAFAPGGEGPAGPLGPTGPETLVGVLGMRPVETMARGPHLHVDDLVVAGGRRGRGVGRRLLARAEEIARERGLAAVFLDSRPEVLGFYEKLGYGPHTATLVRKVLTA